MPVHRADLRSDRSMVGLSKTDQISQQLASSSGADASALLTWLEYCAQRDAMLHRIKNCALVSWLLVFTAATLSTLMAWHFQNSTLEVLEVFNDGNTTNGSFSGFGRLGRSGHSGHSGHSGQKASPHLAWSRGSS